MSVKINHLAIISDNYALEGKFYQSVFGAKVSADSPPDGAVCFSDGYVGFNVNPRKSGRPAGFDHFGFDVEDLDDTIEKIAALDPALLVVQRPRHRQFAGYIRPARHAPRERTHQQLPPRPTHQAAPDTQGPGKTVRANGKNGDDSPQRTPRVRRRARRRMLTG